MALRTMGREELRLDMGSLLRGYQGGGQWVKSHERPILVGRLHLGERLQSQSSSHSPSGGTHIGCSQLPVEEKARSQGEMKSPACVSFRDIRGFQCRGCERVVSLKGLPCSSKLL